MNIKLQAHLNVALRLAARSHMRWHSGGSTVVRGRWLLLLAPRGPGAFCPLQNRGRLDRRPGGQRPVLLCTGPCRSAALPLRIPRSRRTNTAGTGTGMKGLVSEDAVPCLCYCQAGDREYCSLQSQNSLYFVAFVLSTHAGLVAGPVGAHHCVLPPWELTLAWAWAPAAPVAPPAPPLAAASAREQRASAASPSNALPAAHALSPSPQETSR